MNRFQYIVVSQNNLFLPELIDKVFVNYSLINSTLKNPLTDEKVAFSNYHTQGFSPNILRTKLRELIRNYVDMT